MQYKVKVLEPKGEPKGHFNGQQGRKTHDKIVRIIESGINTVLIDFKDITFMDSSGFGTLLLTLKTVKKLSGRIVLCSLNDQVRLILELTNTSTLFEVFPNQASFIDTVILK